MPTSNISSDPRSRLRLAAGGGTGHLDGGWWPRSRELADELGLLVDRLPSGLGRVVRASFSDLDWEPLAEGRVSTSRGSVEVDPLPRDDRHLILLSMSDGSRLRLLVVPSGMSTEQGEEALLAAATPGYRHSAVELLATVEDSAPHDAGRRWGTDELPV